uniref:Uncharacterized protein n=1 Tax=Helicotheca tamesis TaxID=374047 RepID=A0A7S2H6D3_9STRA|mmetsp:Transcript_15607/g.21337  ORF Transcript_15607/g.21337 Transcript_15607/m.21337 type:complete len:551 (+) Transcript_15607:121-1773(+)|eukprot:CAMPEP_0185729808 /NCGR_PEP_ID=MMETSP1171-20130828/7362_1 /TAXON_ID=374046 /ORGANISM="Helicotheca tamensis, Strain CCMP826" /LENGTH=550 /DNA_ID=CAMNT_0028398727 /DNA_START=74 /DNA_END=1726 /DNA_ORIENTATION=+
MSGNTRRAALNIARYRSPPPPPSSQKASSSLLSSCGASTPLSHKYLTNGGIVEGVWLFHRHGDRTTNRPLCADHMIELESEFWRSKIPSEETYDHFNERFPPNLHESHARHGYLDAKREPYGRLTCKGIEQMRTTGRRFGLRYEQYGHHARRKKDQTVLLRGKNNGRVIAGDGDFLDYWDVQACSTNYLRTIASAQSFLDGVFGSTSVLRPGMTTTPKQNDLLSYAPVQQVPINVRDRSNDTLNAFDREPALMRNLVSDVMSSPNFCERDARAAPLAARLANFLPGLNIHKKKKEQQPKLFGEKPPPSNINWIHATDHFVCRASHGLPYTAYSAFENDESVESTMAAMASPTLAHLAWRFRQWYLNEELLSAVAAPPLREIEGQICSAPFLGVEERRPFVVYSCHDVTLLSLLYGIGADFLIKKKKRVNGFDAMNGIEEEEWGSWRWWPAYASTLAFELVRVDERGTGLDSHVIRIFLNGKPLKVVDPEMRKEGIMIGDTDSANNGFGSKALRLSDFSRIVNHLEQVGGRGRSNVGRDEDEERDMSIWTG